MGSFFSGPQGTLALSITLAALVSAGAAVLNQNNTFTGSDIFIPIVRFDHGLIAGNNTGSEVNPMIEVARSYSGTGNAHAYSDTSQYNAASNGLAYDSYDAVSSIVGTHNLDHVRGFQCKMTQSGSGTIGELSCFGVFSLTDNANTTTNIKEFGGVDATGSAPVTNQYGFYMPDLTHGTNNWAIFTNKGKAHFGDNVDMAKTLVVSNQTTVAGLHVAITGEKKTNFTPALWQDTIIANASSTQITITLPQSNATSSGKIFFIKDVGFSTGNVVQVLTTGGQTIDGFTGLNMTHNGDTLIVQSNGTGWNRLNMYVPSQGDFPIKGSTTRWVSSADTAFGTTTSADLASRQYAIPWVVHNNIQIDKIAIEASTAANPTSTTCRLGIYTDNGNGYPLNLVSGSDTATNIMTQNMRVYNFSSPITLHAGLYWKSVSCGTAATSQPSFRAEGQGSVPAVLGWSSAGGVSQVGNMYIATVTYGALPSTFPAGAAINVANTLAAFQILVEISKG